MTKDEFSKKLTKEELADAKAELELKQIEAKKLEAESKIKTLEVKSKEFAEREVTAKQKNQLELETAKARKELVEAKAAFAKQKLERQEAYKAENTKKKVEAEVKRKEREAAKAIQIKEKEELKNLRESDKAVTAENKFKEQEAKAKEKVKASEAAVRAKKEVAEAKAKAKIEASNLKAKEKAEKITAKELTKKQEKLLAERATGRKLKEVRNSLEAQGVKLNCPVNAVSVVTEAALNMPEGSKVGKQVSDFYDALEKRGGVLSDKSNIELKFHKEFNILANSAASIPVIKNYNAVQSVLAKALGWKSLVTQAVNLEMTDAGAVRYLFQTKQREVTGLLKIASLNKAIPVISTMYDTLVKSLPDIEPRLLQEVLHDHIVIGQFPKLQNIFKSEVVNVQLMQRYQKHTQRLESLGMGINDIAKLDRLAGEISQAFDNARMIVGKYGLDVKALENGGYFPIQVNDEIRKLIEGANETARNTEAGRVFDTAKLLSSSRTSSMPVVLDPGKLANVLGVEEKDLVLMLVEPGTFTKFLRKKFSPEELDKLFTNGTLAQIPALSDELTTFFADELDLPIAGLGEAMVLDPVRAVKQYTEELTKAAENAAVVKTAIMEGISNGWVLGAGDVAKLSNKKDYVQLGSDALFQQLFRKEKLRESVLELFVHRTVADQLNALTAANSSLLALGAAGNVLQTFLKFFGFSRRSMILSGGIGYIGRVFGQDFVSLMAATGTGGATQFAAGMAEVITYRASKTPDLAQGVFASVGNKDFSLQELLETTLIRRSPENMSITGEKLDAGDAKDKLMGFWDKQTRDRFFRFQEVYHEKYGSPATGKLQSRAEMIAEVANSSFKLGYEQLASANQVIDLSARWTAVRYLALNPVKAGRKAWENVDELLRYTDEYFNINDDTGSVGKALGQYLVPFASFGLVAPGSALRHAIRNPYRYSRMMLLYTMANKNSDLSDAEISQSGKDTYPIFLGKDPSTGLVWSVNPGSIDSYLDSTTWAKENFEKLGRTFGLQVGSVKEQAESKLDPVADLQKSARDLFSRVYLGDAIGALSLGIDPSTGDKFADVPTQDTLLGVPMSRRIRTVLTESLPVLRALDRFLPSEIVGESVQQEPNGSVIREGKAGLFGAVPTSGGKPKEKEPPNWLGVWIARSGGLSINQIDPEGTLIKNYNDFGTMITDISKAINTIDGTLNTKAPGDETKNLQEQRVRLLQIKGLLQYNQIQVNKLAITKGYTTPKALQMFKQLTRGANDVDQESLIEFMKQQQQESVSGK
jgi:hypothetical protein